MWYPPANTAAAVSGPAREVMQQAVLGAVPVVLPESTPKGLVLLLSGDAGIDAQMNALADSISAQGYAVALLDNTAPPLRQAASSATVKDLLGALRTLGAAMATRFHPAGSRPVLVGYGSGAAQVFHLLRAADARAFHAGISLDFCPDGAAATPADSAQPVVHLATTWFVFQRSPACRAEDAAHFVQSVGNARLSNAGPAPQATTSQPETPPPGPWDSALAVLQWLDPGIPDQLQAEETITGVPLIEVPSTSFHPGGRMAVMLSGDGGWAELDRAVAAALAARGIAVVGWDSLHYFWSAKTPEQASADLARVLRHYRTAWQPGKIALVGYSFGANVLPFMAARLPADLRSEIDHIALISPEPRASFEFHLSDWLGSPTGTTLPLKPELAQLAWADVRCIYGAAEESPACPDFAGSGVSVVALPGDHHFDGAYQKLAARMIEAWD